MEITNVKEFLEYMFQGATGHAEIMLMGSNRIPGVKSFMLGSDGWLKSATKRVEVFREYENCYFGVCPRVESVEKHAREDLIVDVPHLWVDIDGKMLDITLEEQLDMIMSSDIKPSLVIMSGNGYHCYWKLDSIFRVSGINDKAYIKGILKGLSQKVNGDHTFNLDRVLRIPFTYNMKDKNNLKEVKILHFDPSIIYDVKTFEPYKVDLDPDELNTESDMDRVFKKLLVEDVEEHKSLVQKANDRIHPHIKRAQSFFEISDIYADIITHNLKNGVVDFVIDGNVECDFDLEGNAVTIYWDDTETNFTTFPFKDPDILKVVKHMYGLREKLLNRDHIAVEELPSSLRTKITVGTFRGGRSDLDYMVIAELRQMGYTPLAIRELYENEKYNVGEKYRERYSNRNYYLTSVIKSADKKIKDTVQ